jgi:hypothetical protein
MVVTRLEEVKWVPIDPIKPNGNQTAAAEGDPASGASSMYLTFKKGVKSAGWIPVIYPPWHIWRYTFCAFLSLFRAFFRAARLPNPTPTNGFV